MPRAPRDEGWLQQRGEIEQAGRPTAEDSILPLVPPMRAYARSLTGGDAHAADDLVQDTIVLALQAWDRFTPGTNLKAWLFRILHNRFHSVRTRRHVKAEIGVDDLALHGSVPAFQESRAELRHFKAAFAQLRPSHREALVLYAVHGLPYERIAQICGCNAQAVKSRINRARTALKRKLLGDEREEPAAADPSEREAGQTGPEDGFRRPVLSLDAPPADIPARTGRGRGIQAPGSIY